jgi:hypothetical protein
MDNSKGTYEMTDSEAGQSKDGYGLLIALLSLIGLVVGTLYMWLFQRPLPDAIFIFPIAIIGTIALFAIFVLLIEAIQR